jgi:hypothetical protein
MGEIVFSNTASRIEWPCYFQALKNVEDDHEEFQLLILMICVYIPNIAKVFIYELIISS